MRKVGVPHVVCWQSPRDYKTAFDEVHEEVRRLDNWAARNLSFLSEIKVHEVDDGEDDEENHLSYRLSTPENTWT